MITLKTLNFGYDKQPLLFDDFNLSLAKGQVCGLLGKNGAGKTSLLKLLSGLVFPISGECSVMGFNPRLRQAPFLSQFYLIPEEYYIPLLTAKDYEKAYAAFYPNFDSSYFYKTLSEFDLPTNKLLTTLSHGQKKKFLLSFGLATQCQLLILDEPSNGLDIQSKSQFRRLLAESITEDKLFIISTHQVHDVENLIDQVVIIENGKVIINESIHTIAKHLAFTIEKQKPEMDQCFYYEKSLYGYNIVKRNDNKEESKVDLEILFNGVLQNIEKMQQLFSGEK